MEKRKTISFRLPYDLWNYYKKLAIDRDMSLSELLLQVLTKYKNNSEKRVDSK